MDTEIPRIAPIALLMLTEGEARVAVADALDELADCTLEFVQGGRAHRDDMYVCEARVHRAQANLQRVLARKL
jgi:hypothetical protein